MPNPLPSISPTALYELMAEGEPVRLIDVRPASEYAAGHAAGAESIPLERLLSAGPDRGLRDGGRPSSLYLICAGGERARWVGTALRERGVANLVVVEGGTRAWAARRLPMRRLETLDKALPVAPAPVIAGHRGRAGGNLFLRP